MSTFNETIGRINNNLCVAVVPCIQTAISRGSVVVQQRQQTNGGGRRTVRVSTQRETGALISDGLAGCTDRAEVQEELKRRDGGESCLKTGGKCVREGGGINRAITEGREVIQSREKEKAGRQGHRAWKTHREPFSDEERSTRVHTESGEEEEKEEKRGAQATGPN